MSEHPATRWDVYRDANGKPVTITEDQMRAIWHAINVVDEVRRTEGCRSFDNQAKAGNWRAEFWKSRLLGRMLLDGKPPYDEKPPTEIAACAYWLWDQPDPGEPMSDRRVTQHFTGPADWTIRYGQLRRQIMASHDYAYGDSGEAEADARDLVALVDELRVVDS